MLIRCNGGVLIPFHAILMIQERPGDEVLVMCANKINYTASGEHAEVIKALVAKIGKSKKKDEQ